MSRFTFPYTHKPWRVSQGWGIFNPAYQRFGFSRHNGIDVYVGDDKRSRAPWPGTVLRVASKENGLWEPNGGGVYVSILSDEEFEFDDGFTARVFIDFLHGEKPLVSRGQHVIAAQPVLLNDNTGFSTGPHTHIQLRRCRVVPEGNYDLNGKPVRLEWVDANDAHNSFDPTRYFTGTYVIEDQFNAFAELYRRFNLAYQALVKGRVTH
jgi:murein DD-endopeptidase MepM/ murein hydrolase activator NlpD